MTETVPGSAAAVSSTSAESVVPAVSIKRRQYLLLAGIGALIVIGTVFSVSLTGSNSAGERQARPKSTNILSPGAQVDPRDAWRGQADAQLRSIELKSRELAQRDKEMAGQTQEMIERLRRLETGSAGRGLTALPPPPVPAPAIRPNFGPDAPDPYANSGGPQRLPLPPPPPPPSQANRAGSFSPSSAPGANSGLAGAQTAIVSITLADPVPDARPATKPSADPAIKTSVPRDTRRYIPSGAFTRALLLGGLDAPTGGQAQRNPQPVLMRLMDNAVLPNQFRSRIKECFVVGAGYGDVSSERAYIRTESLSCITRDGTALDVPIKGYVAGEDGKAGMRGRLVSKQGQILANALLAGVASGIGQAFTQSSTTTSISPLGTTNTIDSGKQLEAGLGTGVGKALDRLAQYYITLAEKVFPVIEIDAGRTVDVVLTQGIALQGPLDAAAEDMQTYSQLDRRAKQLRRNQDDDE
jgi:conjugal transfer pilus assembly protein TraB